MNISQKNLIPQLSKEFSNLKKYYYKNLFTNNMSFFKLLDLCKNLFELYLLRYTQFFVLNFI